MTILAAAICVALMGFVLEPDEILAARSQVSATAMPVPPAPTVSPPSPVPVTAARPVYRHSIIPGGVSSRDELARAIKTDKVVAAHYASFDVARAVTRTVGKPRAVYVSYRKGDQVYWTANKLMLAEGETLLSDGRTEMRARCANRISDQPQLPVEADGPSAEELDSLVGVAMDPDEPGLDDASAAGSLNGLGLALASSEPQAASNPGRASPGGFSGSRTTLPGVAPVSSRTTVRNPGPGGPASAIPVVVAPPGQIGDKGTPPGPTVTPGSRPSPPAPPASLPPPAEKPPAGGPDTPVPPPLPPETAPPPPVGLPGQPVEDVHEVPEPGTLMLSAVAFAAMLALRRKRQRD